MTYGHSAVLRKRGNQRLTGRYTLIAEPVALAAVQEKIAELLDLFVQRYSIVAVVVVPLLADMSAEGERLADLGNATPIRCR